MTVIQTTRRSSSAPPDGTGKLRALLSRATGPSLGETARMVAFIAADAGVPPDCSLPHHRATRALDHVPVSQASPTCPTSGAQRARVTTDCSRNTRLTNTTSIYHGPVSRSGYDMWIMERPGRHEVGNGQVSTS
jgi:hypothetical protein